MALVREMTMRTGIAGQRTIDVKVEYSGAGPDRYTFVGTVYGEPGPVVMVHGTTQTFVHDPARFGDLFGSDWVLRFFE